MTGGRTVQVRCYSSHTYAQRPVSFVLEGREYRVQDVLRTWREPRRALFRVSTEEGLVFNLEYDEVDDIWWLRDEPS
ncbi:MAG: hypothetical protein Q8P59_10060 [Dehalococcoidia bacterium]|nr:hypothetical protein [Dehalococcoidia bacterium]